MFFANEITFTLSGIGGDVVTRFALVIVIRWFGGGSWLVGRGWSLAWWGRGLSLVVVGCSFYVAMFRAREAPPPLGEGAFFLFLVIQFGVAVLALCLKK